jgi:hypothetical protein
VEYTAWITTQLSCVNGLYFDPQTLGCTSKYNIDECMASTTTTPQTTTAQTTTTTEEPSVCKYPGLNPDPHYPRDCSIVS